jgi:uncharacterized Zn finger protein (UPF0148 family)
MQTIGHRYHGPRFNYTELCGYCGTPWHRSDLNRNSEGKLYCPNCTNESECLTDAIRRDSANYIEPVRGKSREEP